MFFTSLYRAANVHGKFTGLAQKVFRISNTLYSDFEAGVAITTFIDLSVEFNLIYYIGMLLIPKSSCKSLTAIEILLVSKAALRLIITTT